MEQWAELRREHFVGGVSIKELVRRTGLSRNTVRAALRSSEPPGYRRRASGSKLDPFKDEICRLLRADPKLSGVRVRELIAPLGFDGGKSIVDDRVGWHFCDRGDPQAKGIVERLQDYMERNFEAGRVFANELDFQDQLDRWFSERANARYHRTIRARPVDRLRGERAEMAVLPAVGPDVDRRWVCRVPADPYLRFDTCDYSLDPRLVGQRVDVRVDEREVVAVALETGEIAAAHRRSFARHRTITALEHARALKDQRAERRGQVGRDAAVEVRSLAVYDQLIA